MTPASPTLGEVLLKEEKTDQAYVPGQEVGDENPPQQAAPKEGTKSAGDMIAPPTFLAKLEQYVQDQRSVPDFFERRVEPRDYDVSGYTTCLRVVHHSFGS